MSNTRVLFIEQLYNIILISVKSKHQYLIYLQYLLVDNSQIRITYTYIKFWTTHFVSGYTKK